MFSDTSSSCYKVDNNAMSLCCSYITGKLPDAPNVTLDQLEPTVISVDVKVDKPPKDTVCKCLYIVLIKILPRCFLDIINA